MPYKDPAKQREFNRIWLAKRRAEYLKNKKCVFCKSTTKLEVDHVDPTKKWTHRFWSYRKEIRDAELKKCQILCQLCHLDKTARDRNYHLVHGTVTGYEGYGCHCDLCRRARNDKMNEWRWRTGRRKQTIFNLESSNR